MIDLLRKVQNKKYYLAKRKNLTERIAKRIKPVYQIPNQLLHVLLQNREALGKGVRYIFVLSHMRCYTTLLSHILGSHPEISGYYEQHRSYRTGLDLALMRLDIAEGLQYKFDGGFALDKLLTMSCHVSPSILKRDDVFTVFTLRQPEASIKSLATLPNIQTNDLAVSYYIARLNYLADIVDIPLRKIYFDGEALIENAESTLEELQKYLGLKSPLSTKYQSFKYTGERGYGDPSQNIRSGVILKNELSPVRNQTSFDSKYIEPAVKVYESVREKIKKSCEEPLTGLSLGVEKKIKYQP